jgi:hypothetical protein
MIRNNFIIKNNKKQKNTIMIHIDWEHRSLVTSYNLIFNIL